MSLYLEEQINEQKKDASNDKIIFSLPWILRPADLDQNVHESRHITTGYKFAVKEWELQLTSNTFSVDPHDNEIHLRDTICNVSYTIFSDDAMLNELYSSLNVSAICTRIATTYHRSRHSKLKTPDGFLENFKDAIQNGKAAKIVIFVELKIPLKYFLPPFGRRKCCIEYPADFKNDFRFAFLKFSDYSIKCPDGSVPASKMVLNLTSKFMEKHFMESEENELIVEHGIDVVKPIIYFLHSKCFQISKSCDIVYARRFMEALDFFEPEKKLNAILSIQELICQNFAEASHNFRSVLRWLSFANKYGFGGLADIIFAMIVNEYYHQWTETFPPSARNSENMLFLEIFGDSHGRYNQQFELIDFLFSKSVFTNVMLQ